MKKTLVSALTTALVVGAASTTFAATNPFADVPADHWAYDAVTTLAADGVINGYVADGTFKGDNNMTRYEMAQIVAKALTKTDGMSAADKAMLDKLAAEFSDELANLGVRVAALENKVDNVKWTGLLRYEYAKTSPEGSNDTSVANTKLRLEPTMMINDNWSGHARIDADLNINTDAASGTASAVRAWAQGDYDNFSVKLGKYAAWDNATHGMLFDAELSGVEVTFGKQVQATLNVGRVSAAGYKDNGAAATMYGADVRYVGDKFDIGAGYHHFSDVRYDGEGNLNSVYGNEDSNNIWNVGAAYQFSDLWKLQADYAKSDVSSADTSVTTADDSYNFQLYFKGADYAKAGTYGLTLAYRKVSSLVAFAPTWDTAGVNNQKGWAINGEYTILPNVVAFAEYFKGKDLSADEKDLDVFYGKVEFLF